MEWFGSESCRKHAIVPDNARRDVLATISPVADSERTKHPVVVNANAYSETVRVKLPGRFDVDERPDAVKLATSFGSYATTYEVKDGQLVFTRRLAQNAATIPVEQYDSVRSFFEKIRAAEQGPVVLARK